MAYATKYRFKFDSIHGTAYRILVQKDGYSGSIIERALGRSPVIKRKKSGRVLGTSLEFFAECQVDGEFAEFYTSNPTEFRVQVYRGNSLVWTGFLTPELYSEPDVAPRYDVHVIATDGLGELKLHNFEAIGDTTLQSLFGTLLLHTGVSVNTSFISALSATAANGGSVTAQALWTNTFINVDYLAGKTCYEVLQYLLDTLCACITMHDAEWVIWRENDITSADVAVASVTAMGAGGLWPVGNMTRKVEPAKKVVSVAAPYHPWTTLENPGMTEDAGWTKTRYAYIASEGAYRVTPAEYGQTIDIDWLAQSITSYANKEYNLELTFDPHFTLLDGSVGALHVQVSFTPASLAALYLSRKDDGTLEWKEWGSSVNEPILQPGVSGTPSTMTQYIPPITNAGYTGIIGTLQIRLSFYDNVARAGYGGAIYSCYLYPVGLPYGFKDILNINNGARGEGGDVEVAHGRITSDIYTAYNGYLRGVFKVSGGFYLVTFKDRAFDANNQEFLSLTAKNYARLVAEARFRLTGILDIPSTLSVLPMLLNLRSVYYLVETFSWDLLNDELEVSALSLPAASLSIASETIINTSKESAEARGASGSGGSSGGGGGGGGTAVEWGNVWGTGFQHLNVNGDTTHIVALSNHTHTLADLVDSPNARTVTDTEIIAWNAKQNALTFDDTPTANSNNPVKSKGILDALNQKQDTLQYDTTPTSGSSKMLTSGSIYNALQGLKTSPALAAPSLQIHRQLRISPADVADPHFYLRHPLIALDNEIRVVLMRWHPRRSRAAANNYTTYRTGWGEAQSGVRNAVTPTWYNSLGTGSEILAIPLYSVRQWILNHYICGFGETEQQMREMTLATFRGQTNSSFRFGAKFAPQKTGWTVADWTAHTKSSWLFGFAVRVPNPAFTAAVDPEHTTGLVDSTRQIEDPDHPGHYIQRYIYSETVPFRAFCLMGQDGPLIPGPATLKWDIGFRLEYGPR